VLQRVLGIEGLDTKDHDILVALGLAVAAVAVCIRFFFWWYTGRVWEDALITVLHSENFVNGLGMTHYRVGEPPLHGFTSPLSVLVPLIGDLFKVGFGLSFIKIVSAFAGGLAVLYVMAIAIHPRVKFPAPLTVMAMGYVACEHHQILWGMAGMETQIVTLALLASLYYTIAAKPVALGITLGFCMLARPDLAFWTVIVGLYVIGTNRRGFLKVVAVAAVVYLPWILFTTWYYGSPVPNTILAKSLGYPLWSEAPNLTRADVWRNVVNSLTGTYGSGAIFQPLGPSFGGHGTAFRPLIADHGRICDAMAVLAAIGAIAAVVKRQWALLPALAFVLVYGAYYTFCVAVVFGWYIVPFVVMALLLSVCGLEAVGSLLRNARLKALAFSGFAVLYLGCLLVFLPKTFAMEKRIQEDVENPVRKQVGLFLSQVMGKDDTVGCESLGYIAYYSRRTVYDWPGLASRKVVEYSRTHPMERNLMGMLRHLQPDFLALRYDEYDGSCGESWIDANYRIIASFEASPEKTRDFLRIGEGRDLGFFVLAKAGYTGYGDTLRQGVPSVDPRHGRAYDSIGFRLLQQGRPNEAIECFAKSLHIDPRNAGAYDHLGLALAALGHYDDAVQWFQQALRIDPAFAHAYNNLGAAMLYRSDYAQAAMNFSQAIRCDPYYAQAYNNLANLLASQGQLDEARKQFEKSLEVEPYNKEALDGLARVRAAVERMKNKE
jgi:hypothetical protein